MGPEEAEGRYTAGATSTDVSILDRQTRQYIAWRLEDPEEQHLRRIPDLLTNARKQLARTRQYIEKTLPAVNRTTDKLRAFTGAPRGWLQELCCQHQDGLTLTLEPMFTAALNMLKGQEDRCSKNALDQPDDSKGATDIKENTQLLMDDIVESKNPGLKFSLFSTQRAKKTAKQKNLFEATSLSTTTVDEGGSGKFDRSAFAKEVEQASGERLLLQLCVDEFVIPSRLIVREIAVKEVVSTTENTLLGSESSKPIQSFAQTNTTQVNSIDVYPGEADHGDNDRTRKNTTMVNLKNKTLTGQNSLVRRLPADMGLPLTSRVTEASKPSDTARLEVRNKKKLIRLNGTRLRRTSASGDQTVGDSSSGKAVGEVPHQKPASSAPETKLKPRSLGSAGPGHPVWTQSAKAAPTKEASIKLNSPLQIESKATGDSPATTEPPSWDLECRVLNYKSQSLKYNQDGCKNDILLSAPSSEQRPTGKISGADISRPTDDKTMQGRPNVDFPIMRAMSYSANDPGREEKGDNQQPKQEKEKSHGQEVYDRKMLRVSSLALVPELSEQRAYIRGHYVDPESQCSVHFMLFLFRDGQPGSVPLGSADADIARPAHGNGHGHGVRLHGTYSRTMQTADKQLRWRFSCHI